MKQSIELIDSLAHPTLTGKWLSSHEDSSFSSLIKSMKDGNFNRSLAIGMDNIENYSHESFINECKLYPELIPVAGLNPFCDLEKEFSLIKKLGFKAVKLHPRFSCFNMNIDTLKNIFQSSLNYNLPVLLCTYFYTSVDKIIKQDPFYILTEALSHVPNCKCVLVHGGGVEVLKYAELVRFNPNLLLDLSLTIMKYTGSSIDHDISFLLNHFDRRICIGTDFPEYSHRELFNKLESLSTGISEDKIKNFCGLNLINFLEI
tara:strand:- start:38932 stop:39711 length:780 start_codon:yes stop_codon:yes gene_type:complete